MYCNLKAEMARKQIEIPAIMSVTGKSRAAVSKNLNGKGNFSVTEAISIRNNLFPDLSIDYLFSVSKE